MSSFNLAKKLLPAKKAWKSLTKKLQSKLHKLINISISANKTTRGRKPLCSSHRILIPRSLTRHRSPPAAYHYHHPGHHYLHKNVPDLPAIYVDELFARGVNNPSHAEKIYRDEGKTSSAKQMGATSSTGGVENNAEGKKVLSLPQWRGIDERAEEFISKFREDMKMQRKKSIEDFHEMLARSC
ncbi:hypothetical protein RHGRI_012006 [Rhododendron griersonianum]|uniref:Cotton fiber protein n=1 Tax=Rhododendron griersonianum TaxID=479676 RepID=A0AAV6KNY7_9ERIC|nr:hypothetical protein RHGRI_012006 [Rhododendron griersonianum]